MSTLPGWTWRIPERFNIAAACVDAHLGTPIAARPAVICDDATTGVASLSFAALAERTSRFAQLLRARGVEAGDRVLIRLPNCLDYPVAFLGALKRGAVPVPSSIQLTADELVFLARDSGAAALIVDAASAAAMRTALADVDSLRHIWTGGTELDVALAAVGPCAPPHPTRADDPAYLVYTSGTTGYPKGVLHAHRALLGRQPASEYWFDFAADGGDRVFHAGRYNWTYVLGTGLTDPLLRGCTTIVHEGPADAHAWTRLIARHAATIFVAVPTLYRQILQKTVAGAADVPTLRHCMSAGEPLSGEVLAQWQARFGQPIFEGLGMTECSYYISQPRRLPIRPGSAGLPQPGHAVTLRDPETLAEVPVGSEGMICIPRDDPALLLRYWSGAEECATAFRGDWFLSGDYARFDADGYLWFLGRRDDLINTFGYRVSPYEVERVLKDHPDIADCAVTGEEVQPGKVVVAAHVIAQPGASLSVEAVLAYGRKHLAAYKAPRVAHLVDDLPRTSNGKVLRRALRGRTGS